MYKNLYITWISNNNLTLVNYKLFHNKFPSMKEMFVSNNPLGCDIMVNMYNFFKSENITVCYTEDCKDNSTTSYMTKICNDEANNTTDFTTDYTTEASSNSIKSTIGTVCIALLVLVFLEIT
ncbi:hypothetical protein HHI36_008269 [Cryptolaemus montrouzieri]|uniref:Uncharacterized protein n=1 Tax=Cryptolaemus montrouzieri TaxID=559131 RepID=A0ABD2MSV9_9CUCU